MGLSRAGVQFRARCTRRRRCDRNRCVCRCCGYLFVGRWAERRGNGSGPHVGTPGRFWSGGSALAHRERGTDEVLLLVSGARVRRRRAPRSPTPLPRRFVPPQRSCRVPSQSENQCRSKNCITRNAMHHGTLRRRRGRLRSRIYSADLRPVNTGQRAPCTKAASPAALLSRQAFRLTLLTKESALRAWRNLPQRLSPRSMVSLPARRGFLLEKGAAGLHPTEPPPKRYGEENPLLGEGARNAQAIGSPGKAARIPLRQFQHQSYQNEREAMIN